MTIPVTTYTGIPTGLPYTVTMRLAVYNGQAGHNAPTIAGRWLNGQLQYCTGPTDEQ